MERISEIQASENTLRAFEPHRLLRNPHVATVAAAYLRRPASSLPVLPIPFESFQAPAIAANRFITLVAPVCGRHCVFIPRSGGPERFWAESRVVEFVAPAWKMTLPRKD